ncbi:MAG: sensor domain-containing diguanylate cyclase [Campylobacterales bacterium]|nr:sensor domain-containing diguanylate cyclase [Campylobacterales bacterium]
MSNYKILNSIHIKINIFYISDHSLHSNTIVKTIKKFFNSFEEYNYEKGILANFNPDVHNLIICNLSNNVNINTYLTNKLKELSAKTLIILALPADSNLSLYDSLKVDHEISSFDKTNINAVINVVSNAVKYLQKISTINSLENKINEFKRMLELYDEHIIVSIFDLDGNIKYVTNAYSKISDYSKEELLGQNFFKINYLKDTNNIWETIKSNNIWKGEIKIRGKNNSIYWVYATISPEYDENNKHIGYSSIQQDITEKKHIEELSIRDGLTNLYNRRHFNILLKKEIKLSVRHNYNLNLILLDVDFFKQYNDEYGHPQGDEALIKLAKCIKNTFRRPDDYSFRVGGEEFAVIFSVEDKKDCLNILNNLKDSLKKEKIEHNKSSVSKYLTISIGVIEIKENDNEKEIYQNVDLALYKAKNSGRNKISFFKMNANIDTYDI